MHFSPAAAAVLAFSSTALAAPYSTSNSTGNATTTTTLQSVPSATAAAGLAGLSKTAQIFLSDTRADALNNVLTKNEDFVFNFVNHKTGGPGKGGEIVAANRKTFPALTNTGIGAAVGFLGPCGFNTPHVHPRATELAIVLQGTIVSSMFPENGVNQANGKPREILNILNEFDTTVFYQGSVHSQFNPTCEPAIFFAALSSEDFGVGQVAQELFGASHTDATAAVFGNSFDGAEVDQLRSSLSANVALGIETCLSQCGIKKRN